MADITGLIVNTLIADITDGVPAWLINKAGPREVQSLKTLLDWKNDPRAEGKIIRLYRPTAIVEKSILVQSLSNAPDLNAPANQENLSNTDSVQITIITIDGALSNKTCTRVQNVMKGPLASTSRKIFIAKRDLVLESYDDATSTYRFVLRYRFRSIDT